MKKKYIIIIVIAIIIAISILVIFTVRKEKRINRFQFPATLVVNNYTEYIYADTMVLVILNRIFDYDTMKINIYNMKTMLDIGEIQLAGYIVKNYFEPHSYNMFIRINDLPVSIHTFLSHELCHLKQMEDGDLVQIDYTKVLYMGDTIYFNKVPYNKRPYEKDASNDDFMIEKQLKSLLYEK